MNLRVSYNAGNLVNSWRTVSFSGLWSCSLHLFSLYGCKTWSPTLRNDVGHRYKVLETHCMGCGAGAELLVDYQRVFIHQLMRKWIVFKTVLRFTLKLTLKQLQHVSVQSVTPSSGSADNSLVHQLVNKKNFDNIKMLHGMCVKMFVDCVAPHITPPVDCVAPHITPPIQCYVTESHQTGDPARTTRTFPCTPLLMIPASRRSVAATERLGWRSNLRPLSYSCRFVTSGSPYREWSSQ